MKANKNNKHGGLLIGRAYRISLSIQIQFCVFNASSWSPLYIHHFQHILYIVLTILDYIIVNMSTRSKKKQPVKNDNSLDSAGNTNVNGSAMTAQATTANTTDIAATATIVYNQQCSHP